MLLPPGKENMIKPTKTKYLQAKMTAEEQENLQKLADLEGLTMSAYIRMLIKREVNKKLK